MAIGVPQGFRLSGVHCGIKRNPNKPDLSLIVSDADCTSAGVYTQNRVFAAPVGLDRARTPGEHARLIVINSGNANACTGPRGDEDALQMTRLAAEAVGVSPESALVLSTGVIGEFLPMDTIAAGIRQVAGQLGGDEEHLVLAGRGMLTTDTVHKLAGRRLELAGRAVQITGLAKGAAMIAPNMATMLGVVLTDAALAPDVAQTLLARAVADSFNCISVDGHMSTNDTVLLLANGRSGVPRLHGDDLGRFAEALGEVCTELARAIPADGEGATHLITIEIQGAASRDDAHRLAKSVADSPLVKTAVAGGDPNWGRIVSAAGYAGVPFDPQGVSLHVNGTLLYERGVPVDFDETAVSNSIRDQRDTSIVLRFSEGDGAFRFWTTDLTAEYVRLNADYRT